MSRDTIGTRELQEDIKSHMSNNRFNHTLGVMETAKDLAAIYRVNPKKATYAALLHDLAKEYSATKKRSLCREYQIEIDEFFDKNIHLIHGAIGACMAKEIYKIQDQDILNAIYNHTLGRINMSDLEKVIYIADIIEPSRNKNPKLSQLRQLAYMDINEAMKFALDYNAEHLISRNKNVHPIIYSMIEEYKEGKVEE